MLLDNKEFLFALEKEKQSLITKLETIQLLLSTYNSRYLPDKTRGSFKVDLRSQIVHAIQVNNRFLHVSEIAYQLKVSNGKVSASLSALNLTNRVIKHNPTGYKKNVLWGLPTWVDDNSQVKEEYLK